MCVFDKWLAERELLKHPVTLKALRVVKKRMQFYTSEQIQTMLDYCRETPGRRYTLLCRTIWILSQTVIGGRTAYFKMVRGPEEEDQDHQHRRLRSEE